MRNSASRRLTVGLLGVLAALLMGEALLAWFDPLGFAYFRDQAALGARIVPDPRGYSFTAGEHTLSVFSFTMLPSGSRAVPDTNPQAARTLVFAGDSVTFGYGVNDAQTWVNRVAAARPDLHVINAGISGYNSANVRRTVARYPDAAYILYLIIDNDPEPEKQPDFTRRHTPDRTSWLALYLLNLPDYLFPPAPPENDPPRFYADLDAIAADERVLLVAFDDPFGRDLRRGGYDVMLIQRGTDRVSPADGHPGVRGSAEIAAQILPLLPP